MKIKWLLIFGFWAIILNQSFFVYAEDLFKKYSHADFYMDGEAHGGKIVFPLAEFRLYESADKMNENFGFAWFSDKFISSFPCSIKCGNLTPGGLYSKMKNPLLTSTVSPFGSVTTEANFVTTKLPGYSSFTRPPSYYLQCGYSNENLFLRDLKFSFFNSFEENIQVLSGIIKFTFCKNMHISLSSCSGYFSYPEKTNSSWFSNSEYYHKGTHFCTASQLSLSLPFVNTLFTLANYESPFGGFENIYRLESKIKSGHFIFSFGGVYLPGTILTSDASTESEMAQIKCGVQRNWITGKTFPILIKAGLNSYCKINFQTDEHPLKTGFGVQFTFPISVLSFNIITGNILKTTENAPVQTLFNSFEFNIKNSWYIKNYTPSISISKSFTPSSDFTSTTIKTTAELSLGYLSNPSITEKFKYENTQKDGEKDKQTISSSINLNYQIHKISITAKFSLLLKF